MVHHENKQLKDIFRDRPDFDTVAARLKPLLLRGASRPVNGWIKESPYILLRIGEDVYFWQNWDGRIVNPLDLEVGDETFYKKKKIKITGVLKTFHGWCHARFFDSELIL